MATPAVAQKSHSTTFKVLIDRAPIRPLSSFTVPLHDFESGGDVVMIGSENPAGRETEEHFAGAESEWAKAIAEAERVLRELSFDSPLKRRSNASSNCETKEPSEQSLVSAQSGRPRVALPCVNRLCLDPHLDFVVHDDGMIELTEAGFRRMVQAHSAGLDAVIGVDRREVLRLSAPRGHDPCRQANQRPRTADLIEAHVQRTQPIAELLKAEESSEAAMDMINKERERHEIESLLPWHAAGTLDRRDIERVERALAEDSELAQRYELVREELAETIRLNEMLGAPSARAAEKLFAAIDAEETQGTRTRLHSFSGAPEGLATASP
jgi:hypothetical protein